MGKHRSLLVPFAPALRWPALERGAMLPVAGRLAPEYMELNGPPLKRADARKGREAYPTGIPPAVPMQLPQYYPLQRAAFLGKHP